MEFDYQILQLSNEFYSYYTHDKYPELLLKDKRSYTCLLIDLHYDYYICVPYRSEIHHNNCFKFKKTERSKNHSSGLDYSKIVIITDDNYLNNDNSVIDSDEYQKTVDNIDKIVNQVDIYVSDYVSHCNNTKVLHKREFDKRYKYSTLRYFHEELGILI